MAGAQRVSPSPRPPPPSQTRFIRRMRGKGAPERVPRVAVPRQRRPYAGSFTQDFPSTGNGVGKKALYALAKGASSLHMFWLPSAGGGPGCPQGPDFLFFEIACPAAAARRWRRVACCGAPSALRAHGIAFAPATTLQQRQGRRVSPCRAAAAVNNGGHSFAGWQGSTGRSVSSLQKVKRETAIRGSARRNERKDYDLSAKQQTAWLATQGVSN